MGESGGPPGLLEVATMVHLILGMLRAAVGARGTRSRLASVPSFLAAATPWFFPTSGAVLALLAADALGYFAAGRLLSAGAARPVARQATPVTILRVLGRRRETDEIRTFRLERPPGFDFLPGQYLTVVVPLEGRLVSRCYSICSAPAEPRHLEISVRKQGLVSAALHESVLSGGTIAARKPTGKFVYPRDSRRPIVLLGGGVGGVSLETKAGKVRFGLFGGLEPKGFDAGYVSDVKKGGAYVAYGGERGWRNVLGFVTVRNQGLVERNVT